MSSYTPSINVDFHLGKLIGGFLGKTVHEMCGLPTESIG